MALHSQNRWEEHSDLHCVVSFPEQEAPVLEKTMGRGYGETVHGLVRCC